MCKLIILQAHNPASRLSIIKNAWSYFHATGETDGFGAVWLTKKKKLAWMKSSSPHIGDSLPIFGDGFYECSSDDESNGGWLLLHGRKATCGVNLDNTHPMLDNDRAALIHNGVVKSEVFHNINTTCDSELLLRAWDQGCEKGLSDITGYFAFAMLIKRRDGWHTIIARDNTARLSVGSNDLGWVWSTTTEGLALTGIDAKFICNHKPMTAARFNPDNTLEVVQFEKGTERYSDLESKWAVASSGQDYYKRFKGLRDPELFASNSME